MQKHNFEEDYFQETYNGNYLLRNPPHKWHSFLKEIIHYKAKGRLLDIGCAYGLFIKHASEYYECTGCDISEYALQKAHSYVSGSVTLFQGKLGEIPALESYDIITCFDVLEHIPNLEQAWSNLTNLMKPDGILVITVPVYDGPFGRLVDYLDKDCSHIYRRERGFWLSQIENKFRILSWKGIWRYFLLKHYYVSIVSKVSRKMTTAIMLIACRE